jgi:hypothetical protein
MNPGPVEIRAYEALDCTQVCSATMCGANNSRLIIFIIAVQRFLLVK